MEAANEDKPILDHHDVHCESRLTLDTHNYLNLGRISQLHDANLQEIEAMENLSDGQEEEEEEEEDEEGEEEEEEEEEEEFTFMNGGELPSPVAAEDAFADGQIKAVFPLFNQELLFSSDGSNSLLENLPIRPPVKKVLIETSMENTPATATSSSAGNDKIAGPYCEWSSRKAVEASEQACKKSNSTGFSKIWRFKEFMGRCNSDGRDAYVFLNNGHPPPRTAKKKQAAAEAIAEEPAAVKTTKRKVKKGNKTPLSAHEVYLRSKAKEGERRRPSYLPYRPELVGFFTTLNGGLTKNVHPY